MAINLPFSPYAATNAAGTFNVDSTGYVQGVALPNPAARNFLDKGFLASSETLPMWPGVGISELIPGASGNPNSLLGGAIGRATTVVAAAAGQITGFSVNDQNYAAVNNPQSPVPLVGTFGQVNFFRFGCGIMIPVAMDPSLVDLEGQLITSNVSWDFVSQRLQPYVSSGTTESVTSMTWSSTNGGQVAVVMAAASVFGVGDTINISGATNSGTGGNSIVNGSFVINTWTDNQHFTFLLPAASGVVATIAGTIVLTVGTGILPVRIDRVEVGKSMTVNYNPVTGTATWNRAASVAIIIL